MKRAELEEALNNAGFGFEELVSDHPTEDRAEVRDRFGRRLATLGFVDDKIVRIEHDNRCSVPVAQALNVFFMDDEE
jgi:hypothetical protein